MTTPSDRRPQEARKGPSRAYGAEPLRRAPGSAPLRSQHGHRGPARSRAGRIRRPATWPWSRFLAPAPLPSGARTPLPAAGDGPLGPGAGARLGSHHTPRCLDGGHIGPPASACRSPMPPPLPSGAPRGPRLAPWADPGLCATGAPQHGHHVLLHLDRHRRSRRLRGHYDSLAAGRCALSTPGVLVSPRRLLVWALRSVVQFACTAAGCATVSGRRRQSPTAGRLRPRTRGARGAAAPVRPAGGLARAAMRSRCCS